MENKIGPSCSLVVARLPLLGNRFRWPLLLSGPDPLRLLRVALRIEISTRCVFCVAGRIFIGFLAYGGLNPRFETSGPANSSTKMAY